jgi:putative component of membrane protein insertase Oxa1/YidC/SpoIIIJ protein YidD
MIDFEDSSTLAVVDMQLTGEIIGDEMPPLLDIQPKRGRIGQAAMRFYQNHASRRYEDGCPVGTLPGFDSCSEYAIEAFQQYGNLRGALEAVRRVRDCGNIAMMHGIGESGCFIFVTPGQPVVGREVPQT